MRVSNPFDVRNVVPAVARGVARLRRSPLPAVGLALLLALTSSPLAAGSAALASTGLEPKAAGGGLPGVVGPDLERLSAVAPSLTLSVTQGPPATRTSAAGANFAANEVVKLAWDGTTDIIAIAKADANGAFTAFFNVPPGPTGTASGGPHTITAVGATSANVTMPFQIDPFAQGSLPATPADITISPTVGGSAATVTIGGSNLGATQPLTVYWVATAATLTPVGTTATNASGAFTGASVPTPNATTGGYLISVIGGTSGISATGRFVVGANAFLSPTAIGLRQGQTSQTITIKLDTGTVQVNGAQLALTFDPSLIQVVDSGSTSTPPCPAFPVRITPGATFTTCLANEVDNTAGTIAFAAGSLFAPFPAGAFELATFTVQGKAGANGSNPIRITSADITDTSSNVLPGIRAGTGVIVSPPTASASPTTTPANSPVVVKGGFWDPAGGAITLSWDTPATTFSTPTPDSNGLFGPTTVTIPAAAAAGAHNLSAVQGTGGTQVTKLVPITVSTPDFTMTPSPAGRGLPVTVAGTGWAPLQAVAVAFDTVAQTTTPASLVADAAGMFGGSIFVPANAGDSAHSVTVSQLSNAVTKTKALSLVAADFTMTPNQGPPGLTVNVAGAGWAPAPPLVFTFDSVALTTIPATAFANSAGVFTATFAVPAGASFAAHNVMVSQSSGAVTKTKTFTVAPSSFTVTGGISPGQTAVVNSMLPTAFEVTAIAGTGLPVQNNPVIFSISSVPTGATGQQIGGIAGPFTINTDVNGKATASFKLGNKTGAYTVTACTDMNANSNTTDAGECIGMSATAIAGPAATLAYFFGTSQTATVGAAVTNQLVVKVTDADGNAVAGIGVAWAFGAIPAGTTGHTILPATVNTDSGGLAKATLTLGTKAGLYGVTATSGTLAGSPVSFSATATAGPANKFLKTVAIPNGDAQSAQVTTALANPLVVQVTDVNDNPVQGATVTWTVPAAPASATGQVATPAFPTTDLNGLARATFVVGTKAGAYTVRAASAGFTSLDFTATGTPGAASKITKVSGDPATGEAGTPLANPFVVLITDTNDNPVQGKTVQWTLTANPASAIGMALTPPSGPSGADGKAQSLLTFGNKAGAYAVTAAADFNNNTVFTDSGETVTFNVTAQAGDIVLLNLISGMPQTGVAGSVLGAPFVVEGRDINGDLAPGKNIVFTITGQPANATGADIDPAAGAQTTATVATGAIGAPGAGQAGATLKLGSKVGIYTVTVSYKTVTPVVFTAPAGPAAAAVISKAGGDPQSGSINTQLADHLSVRVTDQFGNNVPNTGVTFTITNAPLNATGQSLTGVAGVIDQPLALATTVLVNTDAIGVAAADLTLGSKIGAYTVTATSGGLAGSPVTFTGTATSGPAANISLVSGEPLSGVVLSTLGNMVVLVTDAGGNPVQGYSVAWGSVTSPLGAAIPGQVQAATSLTGATGQASMQLTLGGKAGQYTVSASGSGLNGSPIVFHATGNPGPAAFVSVASGNNPTQSAAAGTPLTNPLVVLVTDVGGNPIANQAISWTTISRPSGATGPTFSGGGTSNSNANGLASINLTLGNKTGDYLLAAGFSGMTGPQALFRATATAGAAAKLLLVSGDPQTAGVSVDLARPLVVQVTDAVGNPVPGATITWTAPNPAANPATAPTGAVGQALLTQDATTDTSGLAAATLHLGDKGGQYKVTAASAGLTPASITFTATAVAPVPARIIVSGASQATGLASSTLPRPFVVAVQDASGRPVPNVAVNFSFGTVPTGAVGHSLSATTNVLTNGDGEASTIMTLGGTAGVYNLDANCCTPTPPGPTLTKATFNATATATRRLVPGTGGDQTGVVGAALRRQVAVAVQDQNGQGLRGVQVAFAVSGGGSATTPVATDDGGQARSTITLGAAAGAQTITVTCAACDATANSLTLPVMALGTQTLNGNIKAIDSLGTAINIPAGADVHVLLSQPSLGLSFGSNFTNAAGAATVPFSVTMAPGDGVLAVDVDGFGPAEALAVSMSAAGVQSPTAATLLFTLVKPGVTLAGQVFAPNGTTAIVGANVTAVEVDPTTAADPQPPTGGRTVTSPSTAGGNFSLPVPPNTFWKVVATARGRGTTSLDGDTNGIADIVPSTTVGATNLNIVYPGSVNLTGTVRVDGGTLGGANVHVRPDASTSRSPGGTITAANGTYTTPLSVPPVGTTYGFFVTVRDTRVSSNNVGELHARFIGINSAGRCLDFSGAIVACVLNFTASSNEVRVNFINGGGSPVAVNAFISGTGSTVFGSQQFANPVNGVLSRGASTVNMRMVATDSQAGVATTAYDFFFWVDGFGTLTGQSATVPGDRSLTVVVPAPFTLRGKVTSDGTAAVAGATVDAVNATFPGNPVLSAADGTYSITLPGTPASYTVSASKGGAIPQSRNVNVTNDTTGIDFTLAPLSGQNTIRGTVSGPSVGVPVRITARSSDGRTVSVSRGASSPNCDAANAPAPTGYCMTVGAGTWGVRATADGFRAAGLTGLDSSGGSLTGQNIVLLPIRVQTPDTAQCLDTEGCSVTGRIPGGLVLLVVPPNAAGSTGNPITVNIKVTTDAPQSGNFSPVLITPDGDPVAIEIRVTNNNNQLITQFNSPLTLSIYGAVSGSFTGTGFFNEATGNWVTLSNCTQTTQGTNISSVTCNTDHLTKFTIFSSSGGSTPAPAAAAPATPGGGGGSNGPTGPDGAPKDSASKSVGPSGGTLSLDGSSVDFPSGSVDGNNTASLDTVSLDSDGSSTTAVRLEAAGSAKAPVAEGHAFGSYAVNFQVKDGTGNPVRSLAKAVTIRLRYSAADIALAGGQLAGVRLMWLDDTDPQKKRWVDLGASADTVGMMLTATTKGTGLFSVMDELPTPDSLQPTSGLVANNYAPLLGWKNPSGTTQYQIQILPFNNDGPAINLIRNAERSYQVNAPVFGLGNYVLLPGMSYTWRVRTSTASDGLTENSAGWSNWVTSSFRTPLATSATISLVSPQPGATAGSLTPALTWDNTNKNVFYYEVQVSKASDFGDNAFLYWELRHGAATTPANSYVIPSQFPLEPGTTYYWRVRPRIQGDGQPVDWSTTGSFQTQ